MNKILLFLLAISFFGCSETPEKQLLGDFYIRYLEEDGGIKAKAKFKQRSSDREELYYPKTGVSFMDLPMDLKRLNGVTDDFYEYTGKKKVQPEMFFKFVNVKLAQVKQKVTYQEISNFRIEGGKIEVDSGFTLVWEGTNLLERDELLLMVESENDPAQKIFYAGATTSKELVYRAEQVVNLPKGKAKISLMRMHYERFPETMEVQGSFTIEYHFKPFEIEIL